MLIFPPDTKHSYGRVRAEHAALAHHLQHAHGIHHFDLGGDRNRLEDMHARAHGAAAGDVRAWFPHPIVVVVSGGQTGVDRAALDWAIAAGFPHAGWCPRGRLAEDGPIAERYKLRELASTSYLTRTRRNVQDTDATLIFSLEDQLEGGTLRTASFAEKLGKPQLVITPATTKAAIAVRDFVTCHRTLWLNIAGPRDSKAPQIGEFVNTTLFAALTPVPLGVAVTVNGR